MRKASRFAVLALVAGALAAPASAVAQDPSIEGYGGVGGETLTGIDSGAPEPRATAPDVTDQPQAAPTRAPREAAAETLPFTGLDVVAIGLVGLLLLGVGLSARRLAVRPTV